MIRKPIVDKRKYEKTVRKCKKFCTSIKSVFGRNITVLSKLENDHVRTIYGEMINYSEISNGDDAINDAWNVYNHQKVPDKKCGKFQNKLITDDDIKLMISRKSSSNLKKKT